jgi:hypothetical protein
MDSAQTCGNCRYSMLMIQGSPEHGICRRYPPNVDGLCPEITIADWCGEYAPTKADSDGGGA